MENQYFFRLGSDMQEVKKFLEAALECSVYLSPRLPGLTRLELHEVARQAGYRDGEIADAQNTVGVQKFGSKNVQPETGNKLWLVIFNPPEDPDYRDIAAFDLVVRELAELEKEVGYHRAWLDRDVLCERAAAAQLKAHDVDVAITCMLMAEALNEKEGAIQFKHANIFGERQLPSQQLKGARPNLRIDCPQRAKAYPLVKDVIARRTDGRPASAEPLVAFGDQLTRIGYAHFRLWWSQIVTEMKRSEASASPVAVSVLAAALMEGALTFAARYARDKALNSFRSNDFDGEPHRWRMEKLLDGAASCGLLDGPSKARADALNTFRQRIHAGRMLSSFPLGVPDIRPEEARDAKSTADLVVRRVCDWLDQQAV